jgi:hypothetical protein
MSKKVQLPKRYNRANIDPSTVNDDEKSFQVVFATENPVFRQGWDENFNEILSCDPHDIRGERFSAGAAPLLDTHDNSTVTKQMGRVDSWTAANGECRAKVLFSTQDAFTGIWQDIKAGIIRSISVGYNVWVYVREIVTDGQTPNYRATDWEPMEISLASIPADY